MSRWQSFLLSAHHMYLSLKYFASVNFCAAEDLPLVEATEFFFDCLPHNDELTIQQRLAIMKDLRASVREAVHDLYARQQEQRRRRQSQSDMMVRLMSEDGGASSAGQLSDTGDAGLTEQITAEQTASMAMSVYARQWEHLQHHERVAQPFQLRAGPGWRQWQGLEWASWQATQRQQQRERREAARLVQPPSAGVLLPLLAEEGLAPGGDPLELTRGRGSGERHNGNGISAEDGPGRPQAAGNTGVVSGAAAAPLGSADYDIEAPEPRPPEQDCAAQRQHQLH